MTKTYRRSLPERLTNLTLSLLFLGVALVMVLFSGPYWGTYGWVAFVTFLAVSGFFAANWVASFETVHWNESEEGTSLVLRSFGGARRLHLDALTQVRVIPCDLHTVLRSPEGRLKLSHKLLRFEDLLEQIRDHRPDLFPVPGEALRLRSTLVGLISLTLFALGTALTGALLATWQSWLGPVFWTVMVKLMF